MKITPENLYTEGHIRTFSGIYIDPLNPKPELINIEDIAHALSMQCRFGGHLPRFYSVAQHSVMVADLVDPENKLAALLHDASEAYLLDIPRPVKSRLTNYKKIQRGLMRVIAKKFGFKYPLHQSVHDTDEAMLRWEWDALMLRRPGFPEKPLPPRLAKANFITKFYLLYEKTNL